MQAYFQYRRIGHAVRRQLDDGLPDRVKSGDGIQGTENHNASEGNDVGEPVLAGITVRKDLAEQTDKESPSTHVFLVGWEHNRDPQNPRNYSLTWRISATLVVSALAFIVGAASSIESGVQPQNAAAFGVSDVVASLATGLYLLGFAAGSLVFGPFSEILGRNAVYAGSLTLFMIFEMATGLAPNVGAQLAFRFLAGIFGCPPLTCAGGTIADLWDPLEKTLFFPLYAITSFGGPVLGPVIASYMGQGTLSWRWTNWIILIGSGLVMGLIILLQPETYGPLLLKWKAHHLRVATGDNRYQSEMDLQKTALLTRMGAACYHEFELTVHEPIILLISLYMTVLYIVLFTFFDGYTYIFSDIHHISQGLTNIIWVAMYAGIALASFYIPFVYRWTKREFSQLGTNPEEQDSNEKKHVARPENRLWFAMLGAPFIPIGLFWMGWTDWSNISIWSPIVASAVFGFGTITVFISSYMYVIDSYEIYAGSALGFMTVSRYCAAGGMTVVGVPFYQNMGVHYTLTILACISAVITPLPYVFYRFGRKIRGWSRYAVQ